MDIIQILDFDTKLFGIRVAKFKDKALTSEKAKKAIGQCKDNKIKCLYATFDTNDYATLRTAVEHGFIITDIRVNLVKNLPTVDNNKGDVRNGFQIYETVGPDDVPCLVQISKDISKGSRFAFDKQLPAGGAGDLYALWMHNCIQKKVADKIFVAREIETGKAVGVVTCKNKSDCGQIILIGINNRHRRKGIASFLLKHTCSYFRGEGCEKVEVATQGSNIPSLRLYQKNGFLTDKVSVVFHLWAI